MYFTVPEPHKFTADKAPTQTTTENDEVTKLSDLAPCKQCGFNKGGDWHI